MQSVTNSVLDIVVPYERVMLRYTAQTTPERIPVAVRPRPMPAPHPFPSPPPVPTAPTPIDPIDPNAIDPSLFKDPAAAQAAAAAANRPVVAAQPQPKRRSTASGRTASRGTVSTRTVTRTVAIERVGTNCYRGPDPFCDETSAGYADIGDPPLVGAFRNLSNVILRFNNLLVAYADGVSGRLIEQDLAGLSSAAGSLGELASLAGVPGAGFSDAGIAGIASKLQPLVNAVGAVNDRAQLRQFLLANAKNVDDAINLMRENSVQLYATVAVGTINFEVNTPGSSQVLEARQREIRRLIANWRELLKDISVLLRELTTAVENPNGLETRLRNLDASTKTKIDTSRLKQQIATLGTPVLAP